MISSRRSIPSVASRVLSSALSSPIIPMFTDASTTKTSSLSLHDALPILTQDGGWFSPTREAIDGFARATEEDRKSTRLNSRHLVRSYAVFCLKKKKQ